MPVVSVLMPVYNAERYLKEAINSILNQTFKDFELVILNDASGDSSKDIILSFKDTRIKYIENEQNKGLSFSRNRLLSEARADYIAWLDADDIAYPTRLEEEHRFLKEHTSFAMVASWARLIDAEDRPTGNFIKSYIPNEYLSALLLFVNYFVQSSVLLKKSCLPEVHYRPEFPPTEDYDLWVRIAANYPVAILSKTLVDYRIHTANISSVQQQKSEKAVKLNHQIQLENLGILPSDEEVNLHYNIAFRKAESLVFLQQTANWLQRISNQNKISKRFDTKALHYILAHRWIKVCTSNKSLGIKALGIYFKSKFAEINFRNVFLIIKYLVNK
ncbi:glycosyltransferase [Emticicia sp. BO119]|uniref:glycosyltransferase family 2 protein n=1 Tax=Emticicia sp. BO119 TaxID=2757768 RepID=UPI0015F097A1|nr:glycosyltransferase [Emticicia sp. BO119]MBA4854077.1 glycosyltransferase [Emticicia sp. BO119]